MWDEELTKVNVLPKYREQVDTSLILGNRKSVRINENTIFILNEDAAFNSHLKQVLYKDRLRTNKDLVAIYDKIKDYIDFCVCCYFSNNFYGV